MQWFVICMILVMPFERNPYLKLGDSFLGIFPDFTLIKLLGIIGIALVYWLWTTGQIRLSLWDTRSSRTYLLFLALVALTAAISGSAPRAITRLLSLAVFLPIVLAAAQDEDSFRRLLAVTAGVLIISLPYAFRQLYRFGGRLGVGLYEPNYFALALVLIIPLAFVLARQQDSLWKQAFWYTGLGGLLISMIWTGSRGGLLGFLVSSAILAPRMLARRSILPALSVFGVLVVLLTTSTTLGQRLLASGIISGVGVHDAGVEASNQAHLDLFYAGVNMIKANPAFGVGLGKFKESSSRYYDVVKERIAHNTYIHIGAESGLFALAAFLLLLVFVYLSLRHSGQLALAMDRPHIYEITVGMQAGFVGYLVSACFLSAQFEKFFWVILFLTIALERIMVMQWWAHAEAPPVPSAPTEDELVTETPAWSKWY